MRRPLPAGFSVSVPVREATRTSAERAAVLPGRAPDAQLESGCKITSELYSQSLTREVSADDRSEVAELLLDEWSQGLLLSGHSKEQVAAVLSMEWYLRDFAGAYQQLRNATGSTKRDRKSVV